ncbi:non-structural maintenance of chromosomes element 3 homolog [Ctenocephalides felis]|uniref:non-structural maintenance of chromosomes element 3 homolog n=1 Tax=Ctenocephalides felis TaxID=7515 RepID=UPI000E6E51EC|nr:non-structural maintenance of chromosomes element 3 homolog [Ctenocephalides felis]
MPRPRSQKRHRADEDFDFSQTQNSSQTQSSAVNVDDTALQNYVSDALNYILYAADNSALIKRQNIIKYALEGNTRICNTVLEKVKENLKEIYGYELKTVDSEKPPSQHQYFLLNLIKPYYPGLQFTDEQKHVMILRYMILVHIHMSGGKCTGDSLEEFLNECGLPVNDSSNGPFGSIKKQIAEFQQQNYIVATDESDGKTYYAIGYRGQCEYDKEDLEKWYLKMVNEGDNQVEGADDGSDEEENEGEN